MMSLKLLLSFDQQSTLPGICPMDRKRDEESCMHNGVCHSLFVTIQKGSTGCLGGSVGQALDLISGQVMISGP